MTIKLIAVDMDGTFLDDAKSYNRPRFMALYQRMKHQGIRFAVASGNQYWQLRSFFPEIGLQLGLAPENGAWVLCGDRDLFNGAFSHEQLRRIIGVLLQLPDVEIVVCGKRSAWTLSHYRDEVKQAAAHYYPRLEQVDDFAGIESHDTFFKFALNLPDATLAQTMAWLCDTLGDIVTPVTSGHGSIDLIIPGLHKAHGLDLLRRHWNIDSGKVLAFGDGGNDTEMLQQADFGFAMANAPGVVQALTPHRAPDNNQEGVLEIIERALNHAPPFD